MLTQTDLGAASSQLSLLLSLHIGRPTICTYITMIKLFSFVIFNSTDENYVVDGFLYPKPIMSLTDIYCNW